MTVKSSRTARRTIEDSGLHERIDDLNRKAADLSDDAPDRAIELCETNARLLRRTHYPQGLIRNELTRTGALFNAGRNDDALQALQGIQPLCVEEGTGKELAELHYYFGMVYERLADLGQALFHAEESTQVCRKLNLEREGAKAMTLLGTIYLTIGMHDKGLEQAFAAMKLFQEIDDIVGIAKVLNNIGTIYNARNEYDRAIEFFQKSLAIKRELKDYHGAANTLNNIANILFWAYQEYDKGLEYYRESLAISRARGFARHSSRSLQHIGQVYVYKEDYPQAIRYSEEAVAMVRETGSRPDLSYALMDLGFVYIKAGRMTQGIEAIHQGLKIAEELRIDVYINKGYNLLRQAYREAGDFENAVRYSDLYIENRERLFNVESDKRMQTLTIQFEVEKTRQEKELYRLRTERLRQEMEHQSKELTTMAMYLMQKNEFLSNLSRQIENAGSVENAAARSLLASLQRQIREAIRGEKNWEQFEQQFKLVHHDFIRRLSERYPTLTPMELKVGALLRMNLSTKEIAALLYQSPRSVESYRYRLRRKIEIPSSANLATFLASL